jgi:hypothetical protein
VALRAVVFLAMAIRAISLREKRGDPESKLFSCFWMAMVISCVQNIMVTPIVSIGFRTLFRQRMATLCSEPCTRETTGELIKCQILNNPMLNQAVVQLQNTPLSMKGIFELFDTQGRLIQKHSFLGNTFTIERLNMLAGLYFVRIRTDDGKFGTEKLVVMD